MSEHFAIKTKVTPITNDVVDAIAQASGLPKERIVREALHEWAMKRIHESNVITRVTKGKVSDGSTEGQQ